MTGLNGIKVKKTVNRCLLSAELIFASGGGLMTSSVPVKKEITTAGNALLHNKNAISWETAAKFNAELNKAMLIRTPRSALKEAQNAAIIRIMTEDKNCFPDLNKKKLAQQIVQIANECNADPVEVACIIKKETHFTPNLNGRNGKGYMQLTKTAIDDMFQRRDLYGKKFDEITTVYPTPSVLFKAIQHNPALNIRIGTIKFLHHKNISDGNIHAALRDYNGSPSKNNYAHDVLHNIKKYKELIPTEIS